MRPMGDCVRACVASIFEMDLEEVPHFVEIMYQRQARHDVNKEWEHSQWGLMNRWAWSFGVGVNRVTYQAAGQYLWAAAPLNYHPGYWIGTVESRDPAVAAMGGKWTHAVVMNGPEMVHDPNPDSRAIKLPYRYGGETWFELAHPEVWVGKIEWREIFSMQMSGVA